MIHYLKKNIDSKIVYFGTFSNYFHIYRDFEKERLYFQGIIPEYRIPDKDVYEYSYRKKSEKHPSKDNKHKNKNNNSKHNNETTARIASKRRGGGYKR